MMTGYDRDVLNTQMRIAAALEKQNELLESLIAVVESSTIGREIAEAIYQLRGE